MPSVNNKSIFAIVLAAGAASRFGATKQLAELDGVALVRRASSLAAECCGPRSVLVAGHEWGAVLNACAPLPGFLVINEQHRSGMGSSIAVAVRAVRHAADAIIVLLADQPLISAAHIANLVNTWSGNDMDIVATHYAGTNGAPALFGRGCFARLAELCGDQGARVLFSDPSFTVRPVVFEDAAIDIDTPPDLVRLARNARS